jgi:hypothetical protein
MADQPTTEKTEPPQRWRGADTVDEHLRELQATEAGQPKPRFEEEGYAWLKIKALRSAGLSEEADEIETRALGGNAVADLTAAEHFDQLRRRF